MNPFTGLPSTLRTNYRRDMQLLEFRLRPLLGRRRACRRSAVAARAHQFLDRHCQPDLHRDHRRAGAQSAHGHDRADFARACRFHRRRRVHGGGIDHACRGALRGHAAGGRGRGWSIWVLRSVFRLCGSRASISPSARSPPISSSLSGVGQYQAAISYGAGFTMPPAGAFGLHRRIGAGVVLCLAPGHARNTDLERELAAVGLRQSLDGDPPS